MHSTLISPKNISYVLASLDSMHRGKAKIGKKSAINMLRGPLLKKESKNIRLLPFPDIAACLDKNNCTFSHFAALLLVLYNLYVVLWSAALLSRPKFGATMNFVGNLSLH